MRENTSPQDHRSTAIIAAVGGIVILFSAIGLTWLEMDTLVTWSGLNDLPPIPPRGIR